MAVNSKCYSLLKHLSFGLCLLSGLVPPNSPAQAPPWQPIGISGGGGMFSPAISPADPNLMMLNCDMSAAYISEDGGRNWRMIAHAQLRSDTVCRPAFHPADSNVLYASSGGQLKISRDRGKTFDPTGNLRDSLGGEIGIPNWIFSQLPSVFDFAQHRVGGCQIHPRFCLDRNRHFKLHIAAGQRLR